MVLNMLENLLMMNLTDRELIQRLMEKNMKDNLLKDYTMDREHIYLLMEDRIKVRG